MAAIFPALAAPTEPERRVTVTVAGTELNERFNVSWQDILSDVGSGTFTLLRDDSQNADCAIGDMVIVAVDDVDRFAWRIESIEDTVIDEGEEATEVTVYSGRSMAAILDDCIVYPSKGTFDLDFPPELADLTVVAKPTSPDRYVGWMEPDFDDSAWGAAVEVLSPAGPFRPEGFPDPDAEWVWFEAPTSGEHPLGDACLFRRTFAPVDTDVYAVKIFYAARGPAVEVYLDGVLVGVSDPDRETDVGYHARSVVVEINGFLEHTLAFKVTKGVAGMAGLLFTVYEHNTATVVVRSNDDVVCVDAATVPGPTPGMVVNQLIDEGQARGCFPALATSYSATNDSHQDDDIDWPTIPGGVLALRVGDTLLDVLMQLTETMVEWSMEIGQDAYLGQLLGMWAAPGVDLPGGGTAAGRGEASGVTFAKGVNCTSLTHTETGEIKNHTLIDWAGGNLDGGHTASQEMWGRRETFLSLSNVRSGVAAIQTALATLTPLVDPMRSVVIGIEPDDADEEPYTGFNLGDTVTCPDRTGTPTEYRVLSISGEENEDGRITWIPELATSRELNEQRQRRYLRRTSNGMIDGHSRSATPSSEQILSSGKVNVTEISFSTGGGGEVLVGDIGTNYTPRESLLLYRSEITAVVAGVSGSTTVDTSVDASLLSEGVTAASSGADGFNDWAAPVLVDATNVVNIEATAAGGHTGVTVTVLGVPTE